LVDDSTAAYLKKSRKRKNSWLPDPKMRRSTETASIGTKRTMSREAIEVGAFTWSRIQRLYEPDATQHWQRCDVERLKGGPEQREG
jgi:hypothetical protein